MSYLRDVYLSGTRARANAAAPHGPQVPRHRDGIRPRTAAGRGGTAGDNDRYGRNEVTGSTQMSKPGSIRVSAEERGGPGTGAGWTYPEICLGATAGTINPGRPTPPHGAARAGEFATEGRSKSPPEAGRNRHPVAGGPEPWAR